KSCRPSNRRAPRFQFDGNQFVAKKAHLSGHFHRASDGAVTERTWTPPPAPDPPIESNESLPDLGDENHIWRGYGQNTRGVIKLRVVRFLADVNAKTNSSAETKCFMRDCRTKAKTPLHRAAAFGSEQ